MAPAGIWPRIALTVLLRVGWLRTMFGSPGVTRALPPTNRRDANDGQTGSGDGCERFAGLPLARVGMLLFCSVLVCVVAVGISVGDVLSDTVALDSSVDGTAGPPSAQARTLRARKILTIAVRCLAR